MSKLDWITTECAPKNFPIKVISGLLYFEDGTTTYVPPGKVMHNGWGEVGSIHLSEQRELPFPNKIYILWFSYRENKFYECEENLPQNDIENIMNNGFTVPFSEKKAKADKIIVGLAPGGDITLWASSLGVVVEIAVLKGMNVAYDWKHFLDNTKLSRAAYVETILKEKLGEEEYLKSLKVHVPVGKWASYREKFNWIPKIVVLSDNVTLWVKKFNGEKVYYNSNELINLSENLIDAAPEELYITYTNYEGKQYELKLLFHEDTIFKVFKKISQKLPTQLLKLVIEINDASHHVLVFLADATEYCVINPVKIEKYSSKGVET